MAGEDLDTRVRLAAFEFLSQQVGIHGSILPASVLRQGFDFQGQRVRLKGVQGIFKPSILPELPLSITTAPIEEGRPAPYDDGFTQDGVLLYRYRGQDPHHHQNVGLRRAMELRRPLIYFHGIVENSYAAAWPVFVVGDEPNLLRFRVQVDDAQFVSDGLVTVSEATADARRAYITVTTRRRLHQERFRIRVLRAYRERCALCRLKHTQLLDAAHIVADRDPLGEPTVTNGLALCKLHHAAFDENFIGIRPDLVIEVRKDILREQDGPMLLHGLQGFHSQKLRSVPVRSEERPSRDLLELRYERFLSSASG
jgi:putative restriction endonuclease